MIFFNHSTRLGNSFNLTFLQEIFFLEYGLPSVFPEGRNFRKLFLTYQDNPYGYVGNTNAFKELEMAQDQSETLFTTLLLENNITVEDLHKLVHKYGKQQNETYELDVNSTRIISVNRNTPFDIARLKEKPHSVLNRAHYLHPTADISSLRKKHATVFRNKLSFRPDIQKGISKHILERRDDYIQIGVHIRRTDYKTYMSGAYYFSDQQYANVCHKIENCLTNYPTRFIIFSDEAIDLDLYSGLDISINGGNMYEDFASMTQCNCLIGPPSSFANAASFIGDVSRIVMRDVDSIGKLLSNPDSIIKRKSFPSVA